MPFPKKTFETWRRKPSQNAGVQLDWCSCLWSLGRLKSSWREHGIKKHQITGEKKSFKVPRQKTQSSEAGTEGPLSEPKSGKRLLKYKVDSFLSVYYLQSTFMTSLTCDYQTQVVITNVKSWLRDLT